MILFIIYFNFRYNDIEVQTFLHISTLLDPRFKDFPMTEGEEHLPTIKQELMKMVETEGSVTYDAKQSPTEIDTDMPKKTRVSGLCSWYWFVITPLLRFVIAQPSI